MQKLADFVAAFSHRLKPVTRDGSQFAGVIFQPRVDGGIALDSAVESQEIGFHRRSAFFFRELYFLEVALRSLHEKGAGLSWAEE
jgi:hypothetical protein